MVTASLLSHLSDEVLLFVFHVQNVLDVTLTICVSVTSTLKNNRTWTVSLFVQTVSPTS